MTPTDSQRYLSTRGGSSGFSFEDVVIKGLAADGGLFIPEEIPKLPDNWESEWRDLSFQELAFQILSLYISPSEIPPEDLKDIIRRSYSTFRHPDITPLVELDEERNLYLLELFHGPTFAFKDVALQLLGNLFEYFLVRRNEGKVGKDRHHLTVIGATSGDTGSAAIYGLRGKQDISIFILYPNGRVSPIQQAQMTTVLDANVHSLSVEGSFDDCQDALKELFADPDLNKTHNTAAVNSINWARILAQMTYYFYSYFSLTRSPNYVSGTKTRFVVPSGNFGDILAGWFSKRMGLPVDKLIIATNENDILDRFFKSGGHYTKKPLQEGSTEGGQHVVKETHSPAMDVLASSNFERLLWFLAYEVDTSPSIEQRRQIAGENVKDWLSQLKTAGGFSVGEQVLEAAKTDFESQRISDEQIIDTIRLIYTTPRTRQLRERGGYILDPHSAVGVASSLLSIEGNRGTNHISLSTAHPAKFVDAVDLALKTEKGYDFSKVLPQEFVGLEQKKSRVTNVPSGAGWEGIRSIVREEVEQELEGLR